MPISTALLALGFAVSLGCALALVPAVRAGARRAGWLDAPDGDRKLHATAIPNVGGVAIVGAVGIGIVAAVVAARHVEGSAPLALPHPLVLVGALGIAVVGFWDDLRDLAAAPKLVAQLAVTACAFGGGARVHVFDGLLGDGALGLVVSFALTAIWMVGMMNAVNLIDGMDGLAAGVVAIAFAGLAAVHALHGDLGGMLLVATVVGALLGFLRYNFAPATIFMGDSGSLFLGYALAAYGLRGSGHEDPVLALVVAAVAMGVPVLDLSVSIVRRRLTGRPLSAPDSDHIHHRLQAQMPTHRAALALYGLAGVLSAGAVAMSGLEPLAAAATFAVGAAVVYLFLATVGYLPSVEGFRRARRAREAAGPTGRVRRDRLEPVTGPER